MALIDKSVAKKALTGNELDFAHDMARGAGTTMRRIFRLGMEKTLKLDRTVVTQADIQINQILLDCVRGSFPTHDVLAEEKSDMSRRSPLVWVCDPIDGTMSFCRGIPTCVFSLALVNEGVPIVGVVYDPFMDRMFSAVAEEGAFVNGKKISVSKESKLEGTVIGHCSWKSAKFKITGMWEKLEKMNANTIMLGSITYMGAMVACGEFGGMVHPAISAHDSAALKLIVEEAGGKVTDLFGNDQRYDRELKGCIMSNGRLHDKLVGMVRRQLDTAQL